MQKPVVDSAARDKEPRSPTLDVVPPPTSGDKPEFTLRAVIIGLFVAAIIGFIYPAIVLKIGFGPNISVVSAFLGYIAISVIGAVATRLFGRDVRGTRFENNLVQTAGTAAGQSGFMCVVFAAMDMLAAKPALGFSLSFAPWQVFAWLSVGGLIGVLLAVPLRRHYIDEEKLTFADGVAAGETLMVLDQDKKAGRIRLIMLGIGTAISGVVTFLQNLRFPKNAEHPLVPGETFFGSEALQKLNMGLGLSVLSFGSGLLVGLRISLSMAVGMVIAWIIAPRVLHANGIIADQTFRLTLQWVMWPATGLMVAGGMTALFLKWKLIVRTFKDIKVGRGSQTDFPIKWVFIGAGALSIVMIVLQWFSLGIAPWVTTLALVISVPLMIVGTRVLGETNWAPISAMANFVQGIFAGIAPGNMGVNMIASGMSGTVASNGEHLMQDYKAGKIVGSNNKFLTYMQLIAVPVGAAAVAISYPLWKARYGIGPTKYGVDTALADPNQPGLSSPISVKWAGFAELLSSGLDKLPKYALTALLVSIVVGVVITIFENKFKKYLPSPTGIGLGMLIPGLYVLPMVLGGVTQYIWSKTNPKQEEELNTPLASGMIVGEAMLLLLLFVFVFFGWGKGYLGAGGH